MQLNSINLNSRPVFGCNNPECTPCNEVKMILTEHGAKPECVDKFLNAFAPENGLKSKKDGRIKTHKELVEGLNISKLGKEALNLCAKIINNSGK